MKKLSLALLAMATALAITPSAMADTIVALTSSLQSTDSTVVSAADFSSLVPLATISGSVTGSTGFTAQYFEWVYSDPTNPLGAGDLVFVYSIKNTGGDSIDTISTTNFGSYSVSEGNEIPSATGDKVELAADVLGVPTLDTKTPLYAGQTLDPIVLFTNAKTYGSGSISFIDGSVATDSALVPGPEPSSLLLLGTGLLGLAFVAFRKAKSSGMVLSM
jgi:hypothetical protein